MKAKTSTLSQSLLRDIRNINRNKGKLSSLYIMTKSVFIVVSATILVKLLVILALVEAFRSRILHFIVDLWHLGPGGSAW